MYEEAYVPGGETEVLVGGVRCVEGTDPVADVVGEELGVWLAASLPAVVRGLNRPGMSGDSSSWKGWGHVRWFIEEVPAGAA